jgi:hypothetical protein
VIDVTLGSYGLLDSIMDWEVSLEPSLSDHRHILFTLRGSVPVRLTRNPRGTNWGPCREDLRERLEGVPKMSMKDEAGLGLAAHWIQQALIQAYEGNCPLRPVRRGRKSLKWTLELQRLRRDVRRLFNNARRIMIHIAGNSTERPNEGTGRRCERLPKRHVGLSAAP